MRFNLSREDRQYIAVKEFPPERKCTICGETKPISKFRRYHSEYYDTFFISPMCLNCSRIHSSVYLGITVTEKVLSKVFTNVQRMPHGNHGYDFICGKGFKVDAKSACLAIPTGTYTYWTFNINLNKTADYFACLAFDNRHSLKPLHFWLIPGSAMVPFGKGKERKLQAVNRFYSLIMSYRNLDKWKEYEKPIDKVLTSCNIMKSKLSYFMEL